MPIDQTANCAGPLTGRPGSGCAKEAHRAARENRGATGFVIGGRFSADAEAAGPSTGLRAYP